MLLPTAILWPLWMRLAFRRWGLLIRLSEEGRIPARVKLGLWNRHYDEVCPELKANRQRAKQLVALAVLSLVRLFGVYLAAGAYILT